MAASAPLQHRRRKALTGGTFSSLGACRAPSCCRMRLLPFQPSLFHYYYFFIRYGWMSRRVCASFLLNV